ncbi:NYN domain-containing protein [Kocuria palustris]|uniref:NYN domain-containing protein n=1 Tax=Kocuria palustris TaxID=71999 RepID=UPI002043AAD8|nr:NYN domain-containing protein [Kocuria palustris]MCM3330550.1 NYN domain-containing protein [Kocuria palustris]
MTNPPEAPVDQRRSALYIDFDNFFGGLLRSDPQAAVRIAERPQVWIEGLTHPDGAPSRRWLQLRCYLNPGGSVPHPTEPGQRIRFDAFRPYFTQAGIEVVDCPALTKQAKNGADIRIVVDVMAALNQGALFEEFVLASSDSDFTPLLQVLRAADLRTCVIATGSTAIAYEALADEYLDEQDIFDLLAATEGAEQAEEEADAESPADDDSEDWDDDDPAVLDEDEDREDDYDDEDDDEPRLLPERGARDSGEDRSQDADWEDFRSFVTRAYRRSTAPLTYTHLSRLALEELGDGLKASKWFGAGSFKKALERVGLPHARFDDRCVWDDTRHKAPAKTSSGSSGGRRGDETVNTAVESKAQHQVRVPEPVGRFCTVAKAPRLSRKQWNAVFTVLEEYSRTAESFSLSEATTWCQQRAKQLGHHQISREDLLYAIRGCTDAGIDLAGDDQPSKDVMRSAVHASIVEQARRVGFNASAKDTRALADWIGLD